MKPVKLLIERFSHEEKQTIGNMFALTELNNVVKKLACLELPWLQNQPEVSCIPAKTYKVKRRWSKTFGDHFHITDVEGRTWILIHIGNYHTEIKGCVLVGLEHDYVNKDNIIDVKDSGKAMKWLLENMPEEFELEIVNL
ncbi:hypothetical protein SAMN05216480_12312 [Pustulibacterium marinum]|uniref:DUF5675 domain-containing protein n=1 Tax=Pustulibacterium marinum TaxID=1224947 RepID=A0A1I7IVZ4_9FLAO|nr:DUF5675 family protein [Pustulibacterium marinum]SFU77068.1 hypothetical protein SAMN05216480_12312 [Pustulibacterium marinum]